MSRQSFTGRRRQQLAHMGSYKLDQMVETPIATAKAILDLAARNPSAVSLTLRGTAGKYLDDTMASIAGYRRAPIRKMENLLCKLCTPGIPYPYADLPPKTLDEEVIELADYALKRFAYLRTHEAEALARRLLALFQKYSIGPSRVKKQINTLSKFVPDYKPEPDLRAQFIPHLTLAEQLQAFDQDHQHKRYLEQARALFNAKPAGHA